MKKIILHIILLILFVLVSPSVIYAETNGYDPKCWNTRMNDDIAVCSRAHLDCVKPCVRMDLKSNTLCLNACSKVHTDCLKSASSAYKVCMEAEKQAKKKQEIKQASPSRVPVSSSPRSDQVDAINSWIRDAFGELDIERIETGVQPERTPAITQQEQEAFDKTAPSQASYSVGIINTEGNNHGLIKYPGSQEFTDIRMGDIPPGSIIKSRDDQIVIFTGTGEGGIIVVESDSEFTVPQVGPLDLSQGTMEIKEEKPPQQPVQPHDVSTEFIDIFVIGTHYWVTHEPGKQTTVGIYEGEIKIKTKDGKTAMVTPSGDGDKPGITVVTQKLSLLKLALAGLVLVAIVGGIILIIRKKVTSKGFNKKKK